MEDHVIGILNRLQDTFYESGLDQWNLPQIVVVGEQSSGKSSVLEHLVGRSFLPRGLGIVTRCPLELRLVSIKDADGDYGIFKLKKTEVFRDYLEITKEIEDQTERLAGGNKGICSTPICLTMYSKTFTNLTLIDLPGLTKVPVGDQPEDIEQQTNELILKYIKNPNSIILAVVPANGDVETCESLKIARKVDPEGVRTLAVVTKLDIMDEGTDAKDMLSGSVIPVKLGIIGVVNRSQQGILENKSMEQSLKDEVEFFSKYYKDLELFHGAPYLRKTIQNMFIISSTRYLLELKLKIRENIQVNRLKLLKNVKLNGSELLMDLILQFFNNFSATMNGSLKNVDTKECSKGGSVFGLLRSANTYFEKNKLPDWSNNDVSIVIKNSYGINLSIFYDNRAFELIIKKEIKQLHNTCLEFVGLVCKRLIKIIHDCINTPRLQLKRYPNLQKEMTSVALNLLQTRLKITKTVVQNIIEVHLAYINYDHPDFTVKTDSLGECSTQHENIISKIERYFRIIKVSIQDMLPKVIMCFMVKVMMERLLSELVSQLCHGDSSDLLQESPELLEKMTKTEKSILVLEKADAVLDFLKPSHCISSVKSNDKPALPKTNRIKQNIKTADQQHNVWNYKYSKYLLFLVCLIVVVMSYCLFK